MNKTVYFMAYGKLRHTTGTFIDERNFTYWDTEFKRIASATLGDWYYLDKDECLKAAYVEEIAFVEETRVELEVLKETLATAEVFLSKTLEDFTAKVTT